jgi:hypothetical protein
LLAFSPPVEFLTLFVSTCSLVTIHKVHW